MRKIILASTSPRRKELFAKFGIPFTVVAPNFEEDMTQNLPPEILVQQLALGKAQSIAHRFPNAIIVSADSIVVFRGQVLGKPKTATRAAEMLRALQNKRNTIISGVAILDTQTGKTITFMDAGDAILMPMSEQDIAWYIATSEPHGRAGAFAIQDIGMQFIKRIDGNLSTIIGLSSPSSATTSENGNPFRG